MMESATKALSLALAFGFSGAILMLVRRMFGGWASDAAIGRGLCLSLVTILIVFVVSVPAQVLVKLGLGARFETIGAAFIAAALCEEGARFLTLLMLARSLKTDDPREFVAGAVALGLGFGLVENLLYVVGSKDYVQTGALRGVLCAPGHLAYGLIQAYGLWRARAGERGLGVLCLVLAIAAHGVYDYAVMSLPPEADLPHASILALSLTGIVAFAAVVAEALAAVLVLAFFADAADNAPHHDPRTRSDLGIGWRVVGNMLWLATGGFIIAPFVLAVVSKNTAGTLMLSPLLLGAAAMLALWAMFIGQLVKE